MQIKPDKTADFESVMAKLHEALTKTDKPERKQQAAGWKIYKSTEPGPGGNVFYVAVINPTLKGADYTVAKILYEVFPTEVQAIFPTYRDSFAAGQNRMNLSLVQDFGAAAHAANPPAAPAPAAPAARPRRSSSGRIGWQRRDRRCCHTSPPLRTRGSRRRTSAAASRTPHLPTT